MRLIDTMAMGLNSQGHTLYDMALDLTLPQRASASICFFFVIKSSIVADGGPNKMEKDGSKAISCAQQIQFLAFF